MAKFYSGIDTSVGLGAETLDGMLANGNTYGISPSQDIDCANINASGIHTVGGFLYPNGGIKDSSDSTGTSGKVLSSTGSGLAWIDPSEGSTTNAINVGTNLDSTNSDQFVAFMGTSSGNNPVRVDAGLKYNPSTNILKADNVELPNLGEFTLGGNQELKMFHKDDTNDVRVELETNTNYILLTKTFDLKDAAGSKAAITATNPGGVPEVLLYHDGNERLKTTSDGVTITGDLTVTDIIANGNIDLGSDSSDTITMSAHVDSDIVPSGTTRDLGGNSNRWRNLYAKTIRDKDNQTGTSGQVLSSTGTELDWINVPSANTLSGTTLASGITGSNLTDVGTLIGLNVNGTLNVQNGNTLDFGTATNNGIRGQIQATETNDAHLIIATSGGEDIAFKDGGVNGTTNMIIRGDGNVLVNNGSVTATSFSGSGANLTGIFVTGMILLWSGAASAIPSGWVLCDGNNSTPDLRNRFVVGANTSTGDTTYPGLSVGATGGAATDTVNISDSASVVFGANGTGTASKAGSSSATVSISDSDTVNTLPPYYALCYIMKT
mgnify:CR=1 FL=1